VPSRAGRDEDDDRSADRDVTRTQRTVDTEQVDMAPENPELGILGLHTGHLAFAQTWGAISIDETMPIELMEIGYGPQHANKDH
jgi:hypothetical protein